MNDILLPLQGAIINRTQTQGDALGYRLLPFQGAHVERKYVNP